MNPIIHHRSWDHPTGSSFSQFVNEGERRLSWAPQAITDSGQWVGNSLRFATREEAEQYVAEFSLVPNTRVVESSDPVNYRWENGRAVRQA
jgi:hypothetical protein